MHKVSLRHAPKQEKEPHIVFTPELDDEFKRVFNYVFHDKRGKPKSLIKFRDQWVKNGVAAAKIDADILNQILDKIPRSSLTLWGMSGIVGVVENNVLISFVPQKKRKKKPFIFACNGQLTTAKKNPPLTQRRVIAPSANANRTRFGSAIPGSLHSEELTAKKNKGAFAI